MVPTTLADFHGGGYEASVERGRLPASALLVIVAAKATKGIVPPYRRVLWAVRRRSNGCPTSCIGAEAVLTTSRQFGLKSGRVLEPGPY